MYPLSFMCLRRSASNPNATLFHFVLPPVYWVFVWACLFLCILIPPTSQAAETDDAPWNIVADSLAYDEQTGIYTAQGNVVVTRNNETISTDFLEYDQMTQSAFARGNVKIESRDGDYTSSERVLLNMKSDTGTLYNSQVFLNENHIYIKGREIRKIGENTYSANKVSITSCDGDNPDWKVTGRDLTVTIEGYGTVYHAAFWTKSLPLLYSPFLVFPVKIKRQTGLLPPTIAQSSRKGTEYLQPFFWAINKSSDATIYSRTMSKRGDMVGAEYRYMFSDTSHGTLMADVLDDRRIDESGDNSSDWGYDDSVDRTNTKRYWYRGKIDQSLPDDATLKLDIDIVSDQDYLREFSSMKNGYSSSNSTFNESFGRDLEEEDDYIRTNSMIYTKTGSSYSLNASTYWYDNVVNRRTGADDTTLQKLPSIEFNASRQRLLSSPFYFDLDSESTYFFRQDTDTTNDLRNGNRTDVYPRLIFPFRAKNWFSLESAIGVHNTYWYIEDEDETSDTLSGSHERSIYDLTVDLSTDFYRIFNIGIIDDLDKIKHTFTPKLVYAYRPNVDQSDYPYFDSLDRLARENTLTLSLNNTFTSRSQVRIPKDSTENKKTGPKHTYNQFCRFKLEQVYDINEAHETDPTRFRNGLTREPFEPLYGEIELIPHDYFSLDADAKWSHYDQHLTSGNMSCTVKDKRGDEFRVAQRYTYNVTNEDVTLKYLETYAYLVLTDRLGVYFLNERDRKNHADLKVSTGLMYKAQCWGIQLDYTNEPDDKRYTFTFSLTGLGEFGSSVANESLP
jgi:LPS-assembly protein